jgi:hypothetical protein
VLGLLAVVLMLASVMFVWHLGSNPIIACGFTGAIFLHLAIRPDRRQMLQGLALGTGFGTCYYLLGAKFGGDPVSMVTGIGAFLGLGSMAVLAYGALWLRSEPDIRVLREALVVPLFLVGAGLAMGLVEKLLPKTFDLYLYAFDCRLGVSPGETVIGWWQRVPLLGVFSTTTYALLMVFPPLYRAWALHSGVGREPSVLQSFALAGLCGFLLYQCCPGAGPRYLFPVDFPHHLPALNSLTMKLTAVAGARKAMPSLQTTWALLVWWSAWRLNWWARIVATFFLVFALLGAIGVGEDYLIDLIVAVPFTLGVEGICRRGYAASAVGFGLTLSWLILLRSGYLPPEENTAWGMAGFTVLITVLCQIPLYRGVHTEEGLALSSRLSAMTEPPAGPRGTPLRKQI